MDLDPSVSVFFFCPYGPINLYSWSYGITPVISYPYLLFVTVCSFYSLLHFTYFTIIISIIIIILNYTDIKYTMTYYLTMCDHPALRQLIINLISLALTSQKITQKSPLPHPLLPLLCQIHSSICLVLLSLV